jgi:hypothetical protein
MKQISQDSVLKRNSNSRLWAGFLLVAAPVKAWPGDGRDLSKRYHRLSAAATVCLLALALSSFSPPTHCTQRYAICTGRHVQVNGNVP